MQKQAPYLLAGICVALLAAVPAFADPSVSSKRAQAQQVMAQLGQRTIAQRLVALYTSDQESTLEVVLGAKNLDDMITRIDNAKSVTQADTDVLVEVKHFRAAVKHSGDVLKHAHE